MSAHTHLRLLLSPDFDGDLTQICAALSAGGQWCASGGRFVAGRRRALFAPSPTRDARVVPLVADGAGSTARRATLEDVERMIRPLLRRGVLTIETARTIEPGCEVRERVCVHHSAKTQHLLIETWPDHRRPQPAA